MAAEAVSTGPRSELPVPCAQLSARVNAALCPSADHGQRQNAGFSHPPLGNSSAKGREVEEASGEGAGSTGRGSWRRGQGRQRVRRTAPLFARVSACPLQPLPHSSHSRPCCLSHPVKPRPSRGVQSARVSHAWPWLVSLPSTVTPGRCPRCCLVLVTAGCAVQRKYRVGRSRGG